MSPQFQATLLKAIAVFGLVRKTYSVLAVKAMTPGGWQSKIRDLHGVL